MSNFGRGLTPMWRTSRSSIFLMRRTGSTDEVATDGSCVNFSANRCDGTATYRHDGLVVDKKLATATTVVSMGVRGATGNGGLYTIDSLVVVCDSSSTRR